MKSCVMCGWHSVKRHLPLSRYANESSRLCQVLVEGEPYPRWAHFGWYTDDDTGEDVFGWNWPLDEMEDWCVASMVTHWRPMGALPERGGRQ